ncbi:MAG TPA: glycosyltransferase [Candidatus Acidoferrales bacterium]
MKISVVIPTYRRAHLLRGCVEALLAGERVPDEVLIVGRRGDAETESAAASLAGEFSATARMSAAWVTEAGHIPPVETGACAASGDLVAIIDDDVAVPPPWLARLVRHFDDPRVGVVGGRVKVPGVEPPSVRGRPGCTSWYGKHWGNVATLNGQQPIDVETVTECNWMWRRDLLAQLEFDREINAYDARLYGLDLTLQARARGFRVVYDPTAEVLHHVAPRAPELARADRPRRIFSYSRNHSYIQMKHLQWWRKPVFLVWWFLIGERMSPGLAGALVESLRRQGAWNDFSAAWRGKRDGVRAWRSRGRAPSDSSSKETAYSEVKAQSYDELRFRDAHGTFFHRLEVQRLEEALDGLPAGARILEVGCGTGRFLEHILQRGTAPGLLAGADASRAMLEQSRRKITGHAQAAPAQLVQTEAAKLPFAGGAFDLVYSIRVLNQLGTREYALAALAEMARISKPGGRVLVEFVNAGGVTRKPTVKLSPREVETALAQSGMQRESVRGVLVLSENLMRRIPAPMLGLYGALERLLAWLLPRRGTRCYVLARRNGHA